MIGAIIGDIYGSYYESHPTTDYNFKFSESNSSFTDESLCIAAVAWALSCNEPIGPTLHKWCKKHIQSEHNYKFGGNFAKWALSDKPRPYGSYGNGSAMRAIPIGMWHCDNQALCIRTAMESALCTHNSPDGITGAVCVAECVRRAVVELDGAMTPQTRKHRISKICSELLDQYYNGISADYENWRGKFDVTCQGTVPPALDILRKSDGFEDAIRKAVSLGGDADTLAAIVGGIAEHVWGVPEHLEEMAKRKLEDKEISRAVHMFYFLLDKDKMSYRAKDKVIKQQLIIMSWKLHWANFNKDSQIHTPPSEPATPHSWPTTEIPYNAAQRMDVEIHISQEQMEIIKQGYIPREEDEYGNQEENWFMYCTDSEIRYYRCTTGEGSFVAHYKQNADGTYTIDSLTASMRLMQFGVNGNSAATALFKYLLAGLTGQNLEDAWQAYADAWLETEAKNTPLDF